MAKYLDENGLLYFWQKVKTALAGKEPTITTKNTAFNKNFETTASNIKMNGTGAVGSSNNVARADHVHPSDTAKLGTSGNGSNVTVAFTAAETRANIKTSEKLSVIMGKLAKWFADLKTVAFSGSYNDLSNKPTIPTKTSQLENDSEFANLDSLNTWAETKIPEYGYQTADQVQSAINSAVASMYKVKGSKATVADLPTTGNTAGDVWNITATGMNYVWTGSDWDALGSELNVEAITNADIDTIMK